MLVLNPCSADARVLKEAATLTRAGYDVRVFAAADATWPAGPTVVAGTAVLRLDAASPLAQLAGAAASVRRRRRAQPPGPDATAVVPQSARPSRSVHALRRLLLPVHRPAVYLRYWRRASAAVAAWGPDVVHAHDLNTLPPAAAVARRRGVPLVYDSHELWRHRNRHGELRPLGRLVDAAVERRLVRRCDQVITVSDSIARWLEAAYRLPREVVVLRNVPLAARPADAPSLRALAGLPRERLLLYTGRVLPSRGLEEAIGALPLLPDDVHLVLLGYGDADILSRLRALASSHGVAGRLHLVGPVRPDQVPAVAAEAAAALVAVQPTCLSYRYALPNKLFEAVQAGVPVVASDLPDVRRVVLEHGLGELARLDDSAAVAAAVTRVLASQERYREAAVRAGLVLRWEVEEGRLLDAYAQLPAPRTAAA